MSGSSIAWPSCISPPPPMPEPRQLAPVAQLDAVGSGELDAARGEALVRGHQGAVGVLVRAGGDHLLHGIVADRPPQQLALHHQPVAAALGQQVGPLVARRTGQAHPPAAALELRGTEQLELLAGPDPREPRVCGHVRPAGGDALLQPLLVVLEPLADMARLPDRQRLEHHLVEEVADLPLPAAAVDQAIVVDTDELALLAAQHRQIGVHQGVEPPLRALGRAAPQGAPQGQRREQG